MFQTPKQISQHTNTTNYYYRADGVKIKKKYTLVNASGTSEIYTEYLDGFQYSTPNIEPIRRALDEQDEATLSAATAGEEEAFSALDERGVAAGPGPGEEPELILSFFPTAEGYYDYENLRYIYQYKDHLGNVRISYVKDGSNLKIMDTNDYYPFGMSFLNQTGFAPIYDPMAIPYNYKYNGKELQETGMYDYGARLYMPDIARWGVIDPLAETSRRWNPYTYAFNNPVRFIDPDGMEAEEAASNDSEAGAGGMGEMSPMDDYKLLKNGNVELIQKTNDTSDTLYATNDKGEVDTSKSVTVQKPTAESGSIISDLSSDCTGATNVNYAVTNNRSDALNVFQFAAANSTVEWSIESHTINGSNTYALGTFHNTGLSPNFTDGSIRINGFTYGNKNWDMHSHGSEYGTDGPSQGNPSDMSNKKANESSPRYIYRTGGLKNVGAVYQYGKGTASPQKLPGNYRMGERSFVNNLQKFK